MCGHDGVIVYNLKCPNLFLSIKSEEVNQCPIKSNTTLTVTSYIISVRTQAADEVNGGARDRSYEVRESSHSVFQKVEKEKVKFKKKTH